MVNKPAVYLEEFESADDLRSNILAFRRGWESSPDLMRQLGLLRKGRYWLYDPDTQTFANAKFVGYRAMTPTKYARARTGAFDGASYFTGGINRRIASRLEKKWRADTKLSRLLVTFAARLDGDDAMAGVDQTKWRFIAMPSTGLRKVQKHPASAPSLPPGDHGKDAQPEAREGGKRLVAHLRTERNSRLAQEVKRSWLLKDPHLKCVVCGFSFLRTYGDLGAGFVEAHHREMLSRRHRSAISTSLDFDRVCSNCHRMLHKMGGDMSVDRLRKLIKNVED